MLHLFGSHSPDFGVFTATLPDMTRPQVPSHEDILQAMEWFTGFLNTCFDEQGWNSYADFMHAVCDGAGVEPEVVEVLLAQQLGFLVPESFTLVWKAEVENRRRRLQG